MANHTQTILWSDNPEKFDEITKDIELGLSWVDGLEPGSLLITTQRWSPGGQIIELSEKNPEITFFAEYTFDSDNNNTIFKFQYLSGKEELIDIMPNYFYPPESESITEQAPCYDKLLQKLFDVFRLLDVVAEDSEGIKHINWVDAEVTASVVLDGFKLTGTKIDHIIDDLQLYREVRIESEEWVRVQDTPF